MTTTSATPSSRAATPSSRTRTRPRSGTTDGSLDEPASPLEAQTTTTRAPASAARARVPPQASDSSSGCAKIASTVRPSRHRSGAGTVRLDEPLIDRFVTGHHPLDGELGHGVRVHAPPIEIEDAGKAGYQLIQRAEREAGQTFIDDLSDGA